MSEAKHDRSVAPRGSIRKSRAKQEHDRTVKPPEAKAKPTAKPKKGMRVMERQLAEKPPEPVVVMPKPPDEDPIEVDDPWWTPEREKAYQMVLQGLPNHQVATELGRHRHTVERWLEDPRFADRLFRENGNRFQASRQRRTLQTVRMSDKIERVASKLLDNAVDQVEKYGRVAPGTTQAAQNWLSEFREQSRREDEIYGLDRQKVDVHHHGNVQHTHNHRRVKDVSFKDFLHGAMKKLGVDVNTEEVDAQRADDALVAITEKALMEGSFLEDLVEVEKQEQLQQLQLAAGDR